MSIQYGKLCSAIIEQHFGETVRIVADALFSAQSRTLLALAKCTGLSKSEVAYAVAVLIKFRLVSFEPSTINENAAEYVLNKELVLLILRYPRYVQLMQSKYGDVGASITEELLRCGSQTASNVILKCFTSTENRDKLVTYRDIFVDMVNATYLIRVATNSNESEGSTSNAATEASSGPVPILTINEHELFTPPTIDLHRVQQYQTGKKIDLKDDAYWKVNFDRFHQDFRDSILNSAIERKLGATSAECFQFILNQMYERTDAWQVNSSNPITFVEIKQKIEKKSPNVELLRFLDQYMSIIVEDSLGFVRKIGETGGGQYVVELRRAFSQLIICCIENIITEKFGSKATRIFRVIRSKNYIEQEEIQKEAMVPAKEAKLLTYKLFEEQFIHIKTIRKLGGGGTGMPKSFFLFYVNEKQVVKLLIDMGFKSLHNAMVRTRHEKNDNKRLMEKSQRLTTIVETMKERGESEEYIAEILETLTPPERDVLEKVKTRIKTLSNAELAMDDTIFILQLYNYYNNGC